MKTYIQFINEMSTYLSSLMILDKKYPGVLPFLSVATRFINKPGKIKDPELRKVLRRLQSKTDVLEYTPDKMKMIIRYMKNNDIKTIEDVRELFYPNDKNNDQEDTTDE